jgi:uncharacterized protein YdaU (DUF1376 family)
MAKFPALPLWTDAYLADLHPKLTLEEHGCMILLMQFAWRSPGCKLQDNNKSISRMLGVTKKRWVDRLRPTILTLWESKNGFLFQKRLSKEHQFVSSRVQNLSERGRKGGEAKALKQKETGLLELEIKQPLSLAPTPTPTPTPKEEPTNVGRGVAPEKALFDLGKSVLGKGSGGLITKLRRCKGDGDAFEIIKQAAGKSDPTEWVAGVLRGDVSAGPSDAVMDEAIRMARQ